MKILSAAKRSTVVDWKTSVMGVLAFLAVLIPQIMKILDSNPDTVADWNVVIAAFMTMIGLFLAGDGGQED